MPKRASAKPGDLVGWRITVTAPNGIAQEHYTVFSAGEAAILADYFQPRGWKYDSREIKLSREEWEERLLRTATTIGKPRAVREGLHECGEESVREPMLAIAEGSVYGLGACPDRTPTKATRNVALSVVQFDRLVARGGGVELVREAEVPFEAKDAKAWLSGKACLPWVRVTRDPKNFRACASRAAALGPMTSSNGVFRLLQPVLEKEDQEVFLAVLLDSKLRVRGISEIARGGRTGANPSIADTLRVALVEGATSVIVAHNHPSGEVDPSPEDKAFTGALNTAFRAVHITLLDHLVVGHSRYWSFADHDLLPLAV